MGCYGRCGVIGQSSRRRLGFACHEFVTVERQLFSTADIKLQLVFRLNRFHQPVDMAMHAGLTELGGLLERFCGSFLISLDQWRDIRLQFIVGFCCSIELFD